MGGGPLEHRQRAARARTACTRRVLARLATVLLLTTLLSAGACLRPATAAADVSSRITSILQRHGVSGSGTGVYIWDLDAARLVYSRGGMTRLAPASNAKLVTTAAALFDWGSAHQFSTELYIPDTLSGKTLTGDVYLVGHGDPSLSTRAYQRQWLGMTTASFERFAALLRREGVRKIRGSVLGDASWFDALKIVPGWRSELVLECGPLSGLSGDEGLDDGNRVKQPTTYAARLLTQSLRAAGIKVTGTAGSDSVLSSTRLFERQYSARLATLLKHMNKESDNFFAEMLLKGLGKDFRGEGTTAAGLEESEAALAAVGVPADWYELEDGSGLSYDDRMTAKALVTLLGAMRQRDDFETFYESLAVAGKDGTLEDRMVGTPAAGNAHAKTGTLDVAVCLSGYVTSANGHEVAFSILMNGSSISWSEATAAQDAIVAALAGSDLPGDVVLATSPNLRQHAPSALEAVHTVGRGLQSCVQ